MNAHEKYDNNEDRLMAILKDELSPEAVAAIAWQLQRTKTDDHVVDDQIHWLGGLLTELLGGQRSVNRYARELGLAPRLNQTADADA